MPLLERRHPQLCISPFSLSKTSIILTFLCLSIHLFLSGQKQRRTVQQSTTVVFLDDIRLTTQLSVATTTDIFFPGILGESPFRRLQDFLSSGKFEFPTSNGFDDMDFRGVLGTHGNENLSNIDSSSDTNGFAIGTTHAGREPIRTGTTQHFIGPQDHIRMSTDPDVIRIFADRLG
mmetsp:Transcript_11578/g.13203  ORF Transcript_11578/g.13203 Transcript_11578/m.13203 type:complete len:176 (-) Transcript_11578:330-857(-)